MPRDPSDRAALAFHPLANIFPLIAGEDFDALVADIREKGVREPVWLFEEKILDGRNRWRASREAGVECKTREYRGGDPVGFVVSLNVKRRHLNATQLGVVALEVAKVEAEWARERMLAGKKADPVATRPQGKGKATDKAAKKVGASGRTVRRVKAVAGQAPDLLKKMRDGEMTAEQAARVVKERKREARRAENAKAVAAAPTPAAAVDNARFATIVIDPPWDRGDEGDEDQLGRARPTYETMPIDELSKLPVGERADVDCHLYVWITNRSLPKGFALIEAWGFRYITCLTWCKPSFGMGNYFRGQTEQVLFAVRGSQPLKRKDVGTWFAAPRGAGGHSSKPAWFYDLVQSCSPGPYLEMFARETRPGWSAWGAELADA